MLYLILTIVLYIISTLKGCIAKNVLYLVSCSLYKTVVDGKVGTNQILF